MFEPRNKTIVRTDPLREMLFRPSRYSAAMPSTVTLGYSRESASELAFNADGEMSIGL